MISAFGVTSVDPELDPLFFDLPETPVRKNKHNQPFVSSPKIKLIGIAYLST